MSGLEISPFVSKINPFSKPLNRQLVSPIKITPAVMAAIPTKRFFVSGSFNKSPPKMTPAIMPTSRVGAT